MIKQNAVETALARPCASVSSGQVCEHEILKETGRVSRHRQYKVYLPKGYNPSREYPLVMVLHGCRQDHHAIEAITGFNAIADREGVIIVYPFITTYAGVRTENCWGWWLSRQRQRGRGEVSDLRRIAQDVCELYSVNAKQRFICGLSAGGAMSVASLAAYSDFWTSGASVAGVPYGESTRSVKYSPHVMVRYKTVNALVRMLSRELVSPAPPILVVQSKGDKMVGPELGANLRDSWIAVAGCGAVPDAVYSQLDTEQPWYLEQYFAAGVLRVAHLLINDFPHGWPGGSEGQFSVPEAPNASEMIWAFFAETAQVS